MGFLQLATANLSRYPPRTTRPATQTATPTLQPTPDQTPTQPLTQAPQAPAPPAASVGLDTNALGGLSQALTQTQANGAATQQYTSGLRDQLLQQLGSLSQPVSASDPGVSGLLQANRLTAQRTAERQRSALAERAATQGLSNSGAFDTGVLGVEQQRGANEMAANAQVIGNEVQQRRTLLQGLLTQALQMGDAQSAQSIQQQLQILGMQLGQSNTYDQQGYNYAALQAQLNGQAINGLLGGL